MKFSYQWHRYLGWMLAPLLSVSALTGVTLLWLQPLPSPQASPPTVQEWGKALDRGMVELASRYQTAKADLVDLPRGPDAPIRVHLRMAQPSESGWAEIDATRGTAGELQADSRDWKTQLFELHEHLMLGEVGPWVLRASALLALVSITMGLRVWWRVRRLPARSSWQQWHRWIGPVAILPLAMMLTTGFVLRSPELASGALSAFSGGGSVVLPPAGQAASAGQRSTLGQALVAASVALPQARPIRIYAARGGVLRVRLRVNEWNPFGFHSVYLREADASVLRIVRASEQPLTVRYLNVVYPLHTGWLPGNQGIAAAVMARGLWTLFALSLAALSLSGAVQRFRKKSKR